MMDCDRCGDALESPRSGGLFCDGDVITCACGTTSVVTVTEDSEVYVQGWTCKHGADDATPCVACDVEDAEALARSPEAGAPGPEEGEK
jgi:hypothetical protein